MGFDCYDVALELVRALQGVLAKLRQRDRSLADQAQRAMQSVALNVAEGRRRSGRDGRHLFRVALGSASEVRSALEIARAWEHLSAEDVAPALGLLDRQCAMLWRLGR